MGIFIGEKAKLYIIKSWKRKVLFVFWFSFSFSDPHETWWKWLTHEAIIFTKFHGDWTKNVANFWMCADFFVQTLDRFFFFLFWTKYYTSRLQCSLLLVVMVQVFQFCHFLHQRYVQKIRQECGKIQSLKMEL